MAISVGVPNSILGRVQWLEVVILIHPFLLDMSLYTLHQLHIHVRIQEETLWCESVLPSPDFPAVHTCRLGLQPMWPYAHTLGYTASVGAHPGMQIIVMH